MFKKTETIILLLNARNKILFLKHTYLRKISQDYIKKLISENCKWPENMKICSISNNQRKRN